MIQFQRFNDSLRRNDHYKGNELQSTVVTGTRQHPEIYFWCTGFDYEVAEDQVILYALLCLTTFSTKTGLVYCHSFRVEKDKLVIEQSALCILDTCVCPSLAASWINTSEWMNNL